MKCYTSSIGGLVMATGWGSKQQKRRFVLKIEDILVCEYNAVYSKWRSSTTAGISFLWRRWGRGISDRKGPFTIFWSRLACETLLMTASRCFSANLRPEQSSRYKSGFLSGDVSSCSRAENGSKQNRQIEPFVSVLVHLRRVKAQVSR